MSVLRKDIIELLSLAWPVVISRLGILTLSLADTIMVGRYASEHLAYFGLAQVPVSTAILALIGLMVGVQVLSAQYFGAGKYKEGGALVWRGLSYGLLLGIAGFIICLFTETILLFFGQDPEMARAAGGIGFILGLSFPLMGMQLALTFFLEGIKHMRPGMVIMIIANIINICANYAFVYGQWGAPELGAEGAGWATFCVRALQFSALLVYLFLLFPDRDKYKIFHIPRPNFRAGSQLRNIGYATGFSFTIEHAAFQGLFLFAGILGITTLSSFIITINIFALGFMIGLGLSTASSVLVGNAYGAKDFPTLHRAIWVGLGVQATFMSLLAVIMIAGASFFVSFYTTDSAVQQLATVLLIYIAFILVLDAGQTLFAQVLRARGYVWAPSYIHIFAYSCIMLPCGYYFSLLTTRGAVGLMDGMIIGTTASFISAAALNYYFMRKDTQHSG